MPVERTSCDDCGRSENQCPECGSTMVTPLENTIMDPSPSDVIAYGEGDSTMEYVNVCWECEWVEEVTVTIERSVVDD